MRKAIQRTVLLLALGLCASWLPNAYPTCDSIDGQRCFQPGAHKSCQNPGDPVITCTCFGMWWTC
jgi:hypothetical protein